MPKVSLTPVRDAFVSAGQKINPKNWSPKTREITLIALALISVVGLGFAMVYAGLPLIATIKILSAIVVFASTINMIDKLDKMRAAEAAKANTLFSKFLKKAKEAAPTLGMLGLIGANMALVAGFARKA